MFRCACDLLSLFFAMVFGLALLSYWMLDPWNWRDLSWRWEE